MVREANINLVSVLIGGFVVGVFASSFFSILPLTSLFLIALSVLIWLGERVWSGVVSRSVLIACLFVGALGLGALRYAVKDFHSNLYPDSVGVVIGEPERREDYTQFVFQSQNGVNVLVKAGLYSSVEYGDELKLNGEFKKPESFEDFDYKAYLAKDDIYFTTNAYEFGVLAHNQASRVKKMLFDIKNNFIAKAKEVLPEPESSLLMGLIVAGREALPEAILDDFRRAGVVHIVVLSGFNVTIIAEFLRRAMQQIFLWLKVSRFAFGPGLFSIIGIGFFVLMTGASATVVRASVMALTAILAKSIGRGYSPARALILAGFVMLCLNPKLLVFDTSFQLSFLATLGIIYLVPPIESKLHFLPERFQFRETVSQTLGTQLAVLPLLLYSIGSFSPVFLPANVLILPAVPLAMLLGFIATALAYLSHYIALPFTFATHLLLSWILKIAGLFGSF